MADLRSAIAVFGRRRRWPRCSGCYETSISRELKNEPATAIHLIAEASRLAFADRNFYLGDPKFVAPPVDALLGERYLDRRAALIDLHKAMPSVSPGTPVARAAWN